MPQRILKKEGYLGKAFHRMLAKGSLMSRMQIPRASIRNSR